MTAIFIRDHTSSTVQLLGPLAHANHGKLVKCVCVVVIVTMQSRRYDTRTTIFSPEGNTAWPCVGRDTNTCLSQVACTK